MKKIIVVLLLLVVNQVYCQKYDYTIIDSKVNSVQSQYQSQKIKNVEELAEYLNKYATTDLGRCRAYYTWITHNIVYDKNIRETPEYKSYDNTYQKTLNVAFPIRRGACSEYAIIFKAMCDYSNIPCVAVAGGIPNTAGHAWNIVKLNNRSYIIDCCWGTAENDIRFLMDLAVFQNDYKQFYVHWKETDPINIIWGIYIKNYGIVELFDNKIPKIESDMINIDFGNIITSKNTNYVESSTSTVSTNTNNTVSNTNTISNTTTNNTISTTTSSTTENKPKKYKPSISIEELNRQIKNCILIENDQTYTRKERRAAADKRKSIEGLRNMLY